MFFITMYGAGFILLVTGFTLYWYIKTRTKHVGKVICVGLILAFMWPLLLIACALVHLYINPILKGWLRQMDVGLSDEEISENQDCGKPDLSLNYPKVVKQIHPDAVNIQEVTSCAVCCSDLTIRPEEVRSKGEPEIKIQGGKIRKEDTCVTVCGHVFHYECLKRWFQSNFTCPICRKKQLMKQCYLVYKSAKNRPQHVHITKQVQEKQCKSSTSTENHPHKTFHGEHQNIISVSTRKLDSYGKHKHTPYTFKTEHEHRSSMIYEDDIQIYPKTHGEYKHRSAKYHEKYPRRYSPSRGHHYKHNEVMIDVGRLQSDLNRKSDITYLSPTDPHNARQSMSHDYTATKHTDCVPINATEEVHPFIDVIRYTV